MIRIFDIHKIYFLSLLLVSNLAAQVTMEVGSGSYLEINNTINIELSGNWINMGTFIPGKSCINFNGSAVQTIDVNGEETFYNLKVNKPLGSLKLQNNLSVQNRLELLNGNINSLNSIITIEGNGNVSRSSGYITGALRKKFNSSGSKNYEIGTVNGYSPVQVNVTSGQGEIAVTSFEGSHTKVNGTSVLQRYWTFENNGIKRADLTFHYLPQDISGIEADYVAGNYNEKWLFPKCETNTIQHTISVTGVTPSGDWVLGGRNALSPAQIALNFTLNANKINFTWQIPSGIQSNNISLERADYWLKDWKTIASESDISNMNSGSNCSYTDSPPSGRYLYRIRQASSQDDIQYSNEVEVAFELPGSFSLEQNFPNPFNSGTKITYSIPVDSKVNIVVFNVTGQIVAKLVNQYQAAGKYIIDFDASGLASGTYIYKITAGSYVQTRKMLVLR